MRPLLLVAIAAAAVLATAIALASGASSSSGAGRLYGGIVGAIIYMVARDQFSGVNPQFWYFWIGLLLVAVVMFLPNGILGGLAKLAASWRRRAA